ncbi:MAG: CBS domain-containing protein [Reichenbachiella sp.]
MKKREKISAIMTEKVVTCDINESLKVINELFNKHDIRHIPILSEDKLVGIMSKTDILRISFGNTFGEAQEDADEAIFEMLSINQVMKHSPKTVSSNQPIRDAAQIFTDVEFHALPVIDDGQLVGIVTTTDIIKYFIEN